MENNPDNQTIPFRVISGCTGKEKYKNNGRSVTGVTPCYRLV